MATDALAASPFLVLTAYGLSRSMTSLLQESRNAVFASVAQRTIRLLGTTTFKHLHEVRSGFSEEVEATKRQSAANTLGDAVLTS